MPAVDDAADAVGAGRLGLRHHQVNVVAEADRHRPGLRVGERFRQRIADRQVLVEQDRAVDRPRRDVLEQRANHRSALLAARLSAERRGSPERLALQKGASPAPTPSRPIASRRVKVIDAF